MKIPILKLSYTEEDNTSRKDGIDKISRSKFLTTGIQV